MFKDLYICLKKLHDNVMLGEKIKKKNTICFWCMYNFPTSWCKCTVQ